MKEGYFRRSSPGGYGEPDIDAPMLTNLSDPDENPYSLKKIINLHTQPTFANPDIIAWKRQGTMSFHIVYYRLLLDDKLPAWHKKKSQERYSQKEIWPVGNLYENSGWIVQEATSVGSNLASWIEVELTP